ncbi:hypothetical protein [Stenotrophomonas sp. PFBMAA-4]|uniref:hypothetical protein n=1 Tax=Stenotrophomonas sp. PFBMAA-4 TaxID=3043301 RepID=UPI0024B4FB26|nr:hypothetical protein [Stenotrophomonas sp. PFBMAA-4]MDI9273140.1 hypothetical protein [Stenotrophomonas sp. PFBMAA-4]
MSKKDLPVNVFFRSLRTDTSIVAIHCDARASTETRLVQRSGSSTINHRDETSQQTVRRLIATRERKFQALPAETFELSHRAAYRSLQKKNN